jgi:hypothetical protein
LFAFLEQLFQKSFGFFQIFQFLVIGGGVVILCMGRVDSECIACLEARGLYFGGFLFFVPAGKAIFFWTLHAGLIVL